MIVLQFGDTTPRVSKQHYYLATGKINTANFRFTQLQFSALLDEPVLLFKLSQA